MIVKLKKDGGQNPIEAAKLGCKIYHGPYVYNFEEIYKILMENGISKKIESYEKLSKNLALDLKSPLKRKNNNKYLINKLGQKTLNNTMPIINNFLDYEIN